MAIIFLWNLDITIEQLQSQREDNSIDRTIAVFSIVVINP